MSRIKFHHFAWGLLIYCIPAILLGAFVRASHSGDGCGNHWPLCNGAIIPDAEHSKTWVEFAHRISTGILLPITIALVVWAFRVFPKGHLVRKAAVASLIFMIIEGLIGAVLVKLELVADNASASRAIYMSIHLANTFILLAALVLTAWWSSGFPVSRLRKDRTTALLFLGLFGVLLLGVSGAITALGDTLFPSHNLAQALHDASSPLSHFLIRMRLWHPAMAIVLGFGVVLLSMYIGAQRPLPLVKKLAQGMVVLYAVQILIGYLNAYLKAPIPMQLVHLFLADLLWMNMVCLTAAALATEDVAETAKQPVSRELEAVGAI
jgi:heme A synthase